MAACTSGICTVLGFSFDLKLPHKKKNVEHCFQTTFCGSIYCWSAAVTRSRNTPGEVDIRTPDADHHHHQIHTHIHITSTVVCLFWLMTLSTAKQCEESVFGNYCCLGSSSKTLPCMQLLCRNEPWRLLLCLCNQATKPESCILPSGNCKHWP